MMRRLGSTVWEGKDARLLGGPGPEVGCLLRELAHPRLDAAADLNTRRQLKTSHAPVPAQTSQALGVRYEWCHQAGAITSHVLLSALTHEYATLAMTPDMHAVRLACTRRPHTRFSRDTNWVHSETTSALILPSCSASDSSSCPGPGSPGPGSCGGMGSCAAAARASTRCTSTLSTNCACR
jgi:hypothetical protein